MSRDLLCGIRGHFLSQDAHNVVNTQDGQVLADIRIAHYRPKNYYSAVFGGVFRDEFLPCLLPGTVFQLDNNYIEYRYFWQTIRPNITVPYVLVTSGTDANTPQKNFATIPNFDKVIADPLLMR